MEFWTGILSSFQDLGPFAPIAMAALESLIPALPMVAIVTMNVAAHGAFLGFLYSWVGTCIGCTVVFWFFRKVLLKPFARWSERNEKVRRARAWVQGVDRRALFLVLCLPFTPSSFVNFAFAVSDADGRMYLTTLYQAKTIMIALLAVFGHSCVQALEDPRFLILAAVLIAAFYLVSKRVGGRHGL